MKLKSLYDKLTDIFVCTVCICIFVCSCLVVKQDPQSLLHNLHHRTSNAARERRDAKATVERGRGRSLWLCLSLVFQPNQT